MKIRYIVLILIFILSIPYARADWNPGPPAEVVFLVGALAVIGGFFGCWFIAWIFNNVVELFTKQKRKHCWFMAMLMFIFLALFLYLDDSHHLLNGVEGKYGFETRMKVYYTLFWTSPLLGMVIGYFITPKAKPLS